MGISSGTVIATLAVSDIDRAKDFYGNTLGLAQTGENPGGVEYESGGGKLFVYTSDTAGTGEATAATFTVEDAAEVVSELSDKGISFEEYEFPGMTVENGVHRMDGTSGAAAWFKDPDGNILGVVSGEM